jgi:Zinc knuckle
MATAYHIAVADAMVDFPVLQGIIRSGRFELLVDPAPLIAAVNGNKEIQAAMSALFTTIEKAIIEQSDEIKSSLQQLEELESQAAVLQDQVNQLDADLNTANAVTTALQNTHVTADRKTSLAKDPDTFSGEGTDTVKRHTEYMTWRSKIQIRWTQDSHEFPSELRKILHVMGLLSDSAYLAVKAETDKVLANPSDQTAWKWQTGQELLDHLDTKYGTFDLVAEALRKFGELEQADKFASFTDFITEFSILADRATLDNATKVRSLNDKVSGKIRRALVNQAVKPDRTDWDAWVKLVQALAENIADDEHRQKLRNKNNTNHSHNASSGSQNQQTGRTVSQGGSAMDLDGVSIARVSHEEMAFRMANGLCKRCGKPGHIAVNCPLRDGRGRGRGGRLASSGRGRGQSGSFSSYTPPQSDVQQTPWYQPHYYQTPSHAGGAPTYTPHSPYVPHGRGGSTTHSLRSVQYPSPGFVIP